MCDLLDWDEDLLDWGDEPASIVMPTSIEAMMTEVAMLKRLGRDPVSTQFKPRGGGEPASADFEYYLQFRVKTLLQLSLSHMRAGCYHVETEQGLGFVTKANPDGSLLELQFVKKGGKVTYFNYDAKTHALSATT